MQAKRQTATASPGSSGSRAERYQRIQKLLGERRAKLELEGGALASSRFYAPQFRLMGHVCTAIPHAVLHALSLLCITHTEVHCKTV